MNLILKINQILNTQAQFNCKKNTDFVILVIKILIDCNKLVKINKSTLKLNIIRNGFLIICS